MNQKVAVSWLTTVGIIGILFGIFYSLFGLEGFPAYSALIPPDVFRGWSHGLYGSVFIGFSVLLFFIGRYAFIKKDRDLMKFLLYGISAWLIVEALVSLYYGVYFNVGVDILLIIVLGYPFIKGMRSDK